MSFPPNFLGETDPIRGFKNVSLSVVIVVAALVFARNGPLDAQLEFGLLRIIDSSVVSEITDVRRISSRVLLRRVAIRHP